MTIKSSDVVGPLSEVHEWYLKPAEKIQLNIFVHLLPYDNSDE